MTLTPTRRAGRKKANVIPSAAEALIDCRVPPGLDADDARERIEAVLGEGDYEIEFSEAVVGNRSAARDAAGRRDRAAGSPRPTPAPSWRRS